MINPIEIVKSLAGKYPSRFELGIGSFLTLDFGREVELSTGKKRAEWHLWIYCTPWRLRRKTRLIVGSEDDRDKIGREINRLGNKMIVRCDMSWPTLDLTIEFEDGIYLETFSTGYDDETEHWMLFYPNNMVLTAGPGFRMRYGNGDDLTQSHTGHFE
jgi:hypothetical protein